MCESEIENMVLPFFLCRVGGVGAEAQPVVLGFSEIQLACGVPFFNDVLKV